MAYKKEKDKILHRKRKYKGKTKTQYYWVYDDPVTGAKKEIASYNKKKLQGKIDEKREELEKLAELQGNRGALPLGKYLEDWLEEVCLPDKKDSSAERYRQDLLKVQRSPIADIPMCMLDDRAVQKYYNDLVARTDSRSQVLTLHKILKPCVRYAYNRQEIARNFMEIVKIPKESDAKILARNLAEDLKALTPEEEFKLESYLFEHALDPRESYCVIFLLMLLCGLRVGEAIALRWENIEMVADSYVLHVVKRGRHTRKKQADGTYKRVYDEATPKSKNSVRFVRIPDKLVVLLQEFYQKQVRAYTSLGLEWSNHNVIVETIGAKDPHKDENNLAKSFKRVCKRVGIDAQHRPHHLRHTRITRWFEEGYSLKEVSTLAGDTTQTVVEIYNHVDKKRLIQKICKKEEEAKSRIILAPQEKTAEKSRVFFGYFDVTKIPTS